MNTLRFGAILVMVAATTFACGDDDDVTTTGAAGAAGAADDSNSDGAGGAKADAPLEIIGEYVDNFMQEQTITAKDWNGAAIVEYDNEANVVYTQNADDAMYDPSKFSKTVYLEPEKDGSFYFCMVDYSLDTLEDAKASEKSVDDSDPGKSGCGTFSWSKASPK